MPRYGMAIDLDRCTGCQACVVACKVENNVPFSSPEEAERGREIAWIQLLTTFEGEFPDVRARFMPVLCMHCDIPPVRSGLPDGRDVQERDDRDRRPDLPAMHRMPLLQQRLPLHGQVLQLVRA